MNDQSRVFHRQLGKDMPRAVGGEGVYLIDADGKRYLDASGGAAVFHAPISSVVQSRRAGRVSAARATFGLRRDAASGSALWLTIRPPWASMQVT